MRNTVRRLRTRLTGILVCFGLSAAAILLIGLSSLLPEGAREILAYASAAVFWLGLVLGFCFVWMTRSTALRVRRKLEAAGKTQLQTRPGIVTFSGKPGHLAMYGVFVAGVAVSVLDIIFRILPGFVIFPIVALILVSFVLHCVSDGWSYKVYLTAKEVLDHAK